MGIEMIIIRQESVLIVVAVNDVNNIISHNAIGFWGMIFIIYLLIKKYLKINMLSMILLTIEIFNVGSGIYWVHMLHSFAKALDQSNL